MQRHDLSANDNFFEDSHRDDDDQKPNEEENEDGDPDQKGNGVKVNGEDGDEAENDNSEDDDDSDDDVVVTIGDIKSGSNYNIKQRNNLLAPTAGATGEKPKTGIGKFSIEEFESVGTINGQTAVEYNIETLEDKPWRKPGADITDFFNYGFNEDTWRAYCERQKRMRSHESGAGWIGANPNSQPPQQMNPSANRVLTSVTSNENPPPPAKENIIQVMTAERREYSRPKGKFDVSMSMPPPNFNVVNEPFYPDDSFSYGYEPTQEQQWNNDNVGWVPSGIKELTPGPQMMHPLPMNINMPPPSNFSALNSLSFH